MSNLIDITEENFKDEILESEVLAVVDFGADWCAPCKKLHPIIEELSEEYGGKIKAGYVDVSKYPQIAQRYAVMSVPQVIFFKKDKPLETIVGFTAKPELKKKIERHLSGA